MGIRNALVGDGFCHDSTNNAGCNFDGGDCCGSCVNMKYCAECECAGQHIGEAKDNAFIANGYCEDENNNPSCNYDGFDCCRLYVVKEYCTDCTCKGMYTLLQKYTQFGLYTFAKQCMYLKVMIYLQIVCQSLLHLTYNNKFKK